MFSNIMILKIWRRTFLVCCSFFVFISTCFGEGVSLSKTRIIYMENSKGENLVVSNSSTTFRYLIQSRVEDGSGNKISEFIVTPPLYNSTPKSENILKIIKISAPGNIDREQLYYLNVKSIPVVDKDEPNDYGLIFITANTRIKLFVRPQNLPLTHEQASRQLTFLTGNRVITAVNPTPYYLTLSSITLGDHKLGNVMLSPYSKTDIISPETSSKAVKYHVINDYGGISDGIDVLLK